MLITIRNYNPETDDGYIYSTWTKYAWYSPKEPIKMPKPEFFKAKALEIASILARGQAKVACLKEDDSVIMGYCVAADGEVKWLCVKKDFRNQGIEKLLTHSLKGHINEEGREFTARDEPSS